MPRTAERTRLADGLKHSQEARALLTAAVGSASQVNDAEVRQLAELALEAVARFEARLELLDEAYRIADRHRSLDLLGRSSVDRDPPGLGRLPAAPTSSPAPLEA
ncbi:MAG TPA: hypothetical protein VI138_05630 [Candidatus Dormibacteraeota bacterium]